MKTKGRAPKTQATTQTALVSTNMSRTPRRNCTLWPTCRQMKAAIWVKITAARNSASPGVPVKNANRVGIHMNRASLESVSPRVKRIGLKLIMSEEERTGLEETFDFLDMLLVDQEHHHMIILLDDGCIVSDQHVITAHHGTDGGPRRQLQFTDGAADDLGGVFIPVGDGLDGL